MYNSANRARQCRLPTSYGDIHCDFRVQTMFDSLYCHVCSMGFMYYIQLMTFDEVNTRMEHDIQRGIRG